MTTYIAHNEQEFYNHIAVAVSGDVISLQEGNYFSIKLSNLKYDINLPLIIKGLGNVVISGGQKSEIDACLNGEVHNTINERHAAFGIQNCTGLIIENVKTIDAGRGIHTDEKSAHITIRNCEASRILERAFGGPTDYLTVDNCSVVLAALKNYNNRLNKATGAAGDWPAVIATYKKGDGSRVNNCVFTNNTVVDCWGEAIASFGCNGAVIKGNKIYNGSHTVGIYIQETDNVVCTYNLIIAGLNAPVRYDNRVMHGVLLASEGDANDHLNSILISNNVIDGCEVGIRCWNSKQIAIKFMCLNNTVINSRRVGIEIERFDQPPVMVAKYNIVDGFNIYNPESCIIQSNWIVGKMPSYVSETSNFNLLTPQTKQNKTAFEDYGILNQNRFKVAVIGDFGNGSTSAKLVRDMVNGWNPDIVITTGDNSYSTSIDKNVGIYSKWIYPYKGSNSEKGSYPNRFYPALGNHDWDVKDLYFDYFTLPQNERYYNIRIGNADLFFIDTDYEEPDGVEAGSKQYNWLKQQLQNSDATHKIVVGHHPPYSSGRYGNFKYMQWPFKEWGATMTLWGHEHSYERLTVNQLTYTIQGIGGNSLREFNNIKPESEVRYNSQYGATLITIDNEKAEYLTEDINGNIIDSWQTTGQNLIYGASGMAEPEETPTEENMSTPTYAVENNLTTERIITLPQTEIGKWIYLFVGGRHVTANSFILPDYWQEIKAVKLTGNGRIAVYRTPMTSDLKAKKVETIKQTSSSSLMAVAYPINREIKRVELRFDNQTSGLIALPPLEVHTEDNDFLLGMFVNSGTTDFGLLNDMTEIFELDVNITNGWSSLGTCRINLPVGSTDVFEVPLNNNEKDWGAIGIYLEYETVVTPPVEEPPTDLVGRVDGLEGRIGNIEVKMTEIYNKQVETQVILEQIDKAIQQNLTFAQKLEAWAANLSYKGE